MASETLKPWQIYAGVSALLVVSGIVFYRVGGAPEATTWSNERADGAGGSEFDRLASAILDTAVAQESKQDATSCTTVRMIESFSIAKAAGCCSITSGAEPASAHRTVPSTRPTSRAHCPIKWPRNLPVPASSTAPPSR